MKDSGSKMQQCLEKDMGSRKFFSPKMDDIMASFVLTELFNREEKLMI